MAQTLTIEKTSPTQIPADEWKLRIELAAAYRLVDHFGWCELIYGHLTAHTPGMDPHFLINPYGMNYDEITASNLIKIDLDGAPVEPASHPISEAGFVIHSAIHVAETTQNRVVMHTHSRAGMAIAALSRGLLPISMNATLFFEDIAYHDFEGPSLYLEERDRLRESLGTKKAMILRNHGLLTVGRTVAEAFVRLYRLEQACRVQLDAAPAGELILLDDETARKSGRDTNRFMQSEAAYGELEFHALMRKLDKVDNSYRR